MEYDDTMPGNYLALDGGLSGLSAIITLEELLSRLQFDLKLQEELVPWRHFKIIIGTGPGGLIAIFIGRLKMTASVTIDSYTRLLPVLSVPPAKDDEERRRNTKVFKEAFLQVLKEVGYDSETLMLDVDSPKIVVVTSNVFNPVTPHFIRSYRVRGSPAVPCTILQAAHACIASQDQFLPVIIGKGYKTLTLADAMAGYANPTKELMREALSVYGGDEQVSTILSLGAGKIGVGASLGNRRGEITEILKRGGAVCEQVHQDMQIRLSDTSVYFRFNVEREMGITPESISAHTSAYLHEAVTGGKLDQAIKRIHSRSSGIKLKEINSVTTFEIRLKPRPSLVLNFVGRENVLQAMHQTHFSNRSSTSRTPAITVLSGLGGSGKTQIALKFALEFEEVHRDAPVYFLNADSEESLKADFETLIRSQGTEHRAKSHQDALIWLATKLKNWLIILDNADNPTLRLFSYLPKCGFGNIIITTRNANHANLVPNSNHHIEGLSESDSVSLILDSSGYERTESNQILAKEIAHELGHLPLALAQAAGYISVHKRLSSYLSIYRRSTAKILAFSPSQRLDDYPLSVAMTIEMALDHLPQEAQDVMRLFAHLDFTSIPHIIIAKAAEREFEYVTWTEKSKLSPDTHEQAKTLRTIFCKDGEWSDCGFDELINQCLQYSLLQIRTRGEDNFYSMHVLVGSYLKASSTLIQRHQPYQLVVRLLGSSITYGEFYESLAFHRLLVLHLRLIKLSDVVETGDHFVFARVFDETGDGKLGIAHQERCLEVWRATLGNEHVNTLRAMMDLANSYEAVGRIQVALELREQVVALKRRLLGPEHLDTVKAMHNVAISYRAVGRKKEAIEMGEQVLEMWKRIVGPEDQCMLRTMSNLAISYTELGRAQDALELGKQVLETRMKVLGPEHPHTLMSMFILSNSYEHLGRATETMGMREKVVKLRMKVLGLEHPDTALSMWDLGRSLRELELKERLLDLLRTAVPLYERVWGEDDEKTKTARRELMELSLELGGRDAQSMQLLGSVKVNGPSYGFLKLMYRSVARLIGDMYTAIWST